MGMVETDLVIDKVCIRYLYDGSPACVEEYKQLHAFKYSALDGSLCDAKEVKVWSSKSAQTSVNIPLGQKSALLVKYGYAQKRYWSWIQFNPSKLNDEDLAFVSGCLSMLFVEGAATLLGKGQLARLDVAIDAQYAKWSESLFLDARLRSSCHSYTHNGSTYLGAKHGKKTINAYDKGKEQFDKTGVVHGNDWIRIEARVRDPNRWAFGEIDEVDNPFLSMLVLDRQAVLAEADPILQALQAAIHAGVPIDQVFWQLPAPMRKQVWEALHACRADWWDPQAFWAGYPAKLDWRNALLGG
jgi:hypothetical protein